MILWFPGGHCRPVEPRRGGHGAVASAGAAPRPSGPTSGWSRPSTTTAAGSTTTWTDGVEDYRLDTNVIAYVAVGVWHHFLAHRRHAASSSRCGRSVERAMRLRARLQQPSGEILWCRSSPTASRPAATRCSPARRRSTCRCGAPSPSPSALGRRAARVGAGRRLARPCHRPPARGRSSPRTAGPWTGTTRCCPAPSPARRPGPAARAVGRVRHGRPRRALRVRPALGHRGGDGRVRAWPSTPSAWTPRRAQLLEWVQRYRYHDGSYWTGCVLPRGRALPRRRALAPTPRRPIVLADDALDGGSAAAGLFRGERLPAVVDLAEAVQLATDAKSIALALAVTSVAENAEAAGGADVLEHA